MIIIIIVLSPSYVCVLAGACALLARKPCNSALQFRDATHLLK